MPRGSLSAPVIPIGWRCPDCGRCYSPLVVTCSFCWTKADEATVQRAATIATASVIKFLRGPGREKFLVGRL